MADPAVITGQGDFKQEWPETETAPVNVDTKQKPAPAPGVYHGVSEAEYRSWDAINFSRLKHIRKSPAHLKEIIETGEEPPSDQMKIGSAVHCLVLTPDLFDEQFAVMPKVDRRTKDGKAQWAEFVGKSQGKTIIDGEQFFYAEKCAESIRKHKSAAPLLSQCEHRESAVVWVDEATGVICKGKIDAYTAEGVGLLLDVKTATDASPAEFQRVIANRRYHAQAAFYKAGLKACGIEIDRMLMIAVETSAPYPCAVYELNPETAEIGRMEASRLLRVYAACMKSGKWPAYGDEILPISLPIWEIKRFEEDPENYEEPGWDEAEEGGGL